MLNHEEKQAILEAPDLMINIGTVGGAITYSLRGKR